jgi:HAD superfamily hydrolase (TIGR01509 family)
MPRLTDFAAFIFDMDGLVLDTEPTYFAAWQRAIETMGYSLEPDAYKTLTGFHYHQVEAQLQAWLGNDVDLTVFKQLGTECWRSYIAENGIAIKPGVNVLLDYAQQQGIPVCLATNSSAVYAHECLRIAGLSHRFPIIVTGDDVERVKPKPDIFLEAAKRLQIKITRCVVFEDSHTGVVAASASGAYTVFVPSTLPANLHAQMICDCQLSDLTEVFETLPARNSNKL